MLGLYGELSGRRSRVWGLPMIVPVVALLTDLVNCAVEMERTMVKAAVIGMSSTMNCRQARLVV